MKKVLSLLVVMCMALSLCITSIISVSAEEVDGFFIYDGVLLEYDGDGGDIVIPDGVTEIDTKVFYANDSITSVVVPEGVIKIGTWAFKDCVSMEKVELPGTLEEVGNEVFSNTAIKTLTIPGSLKVVSQGFASNCKDLEKVEFGYGVQEIRVWAFNNCSKIKKMIFPATVCSIAGEFWGWFDAKATIEMVICNPYCELGHYTTSDSREGDTWPTPTVQGLDLTVKSVAGGDVEKFYKEFRTTFEKTWTDKGESVPEVYKADFMKQKFVAVKQDYIDSLPENQKTFHPASAKPVTSTTDNGSSSTPAAIASTPTTTTSSTPDTTTSDVTSNNAAASGQNSGVWILIVIAVVAVLVIITVVVMLILISKGKLFVKAPVDDEEIEEVAELEEVSDPEEANEE